MILGICDVGDRFRLVANTVTVVDHPELPKLPVARAVWEPQPSLATSAECWLEAGGPHHTVLSEAVGAEELTDFAAMVGTELVVIDERAPPTGPSATSCGGMRRRTSWVCESRHRGDRWLITDNRDQPAGSTSTARRTDWRGER